MAKGVTIQVTGLKELQRKYGKIPKEVSKMVDGELYAAANDHANLAATEAPNDQSQLRQGIGAKRVKLMQSETYSSAPHSAFIEFGTKRKTEIPSDLTAYAANFRGKKGGGGQGFYDAILAWVKRKGIGATRTKSGKVSRSKSSQAAQESAAFAIYLSILKNGIKAQPFFFKHRAKVKADLLKKIEAKNKQILK